MTNLFATFEFLTTSKHYLGLNKKNKLFYYKAFRLHLGWANSLLLAPTEFSLSSIAFVTLGSNC